MKRLFAYGLTATVLSLAIAAPVMAAPDNSSASMPHTAPRGEHRMRGGPAVWERVHAQLKLTSAQESLWQAALQRTMETRQMQKTAQQGLRDQAKIELAKPQPDLAALARQREDVDTQHLAAQRAVHASWLTLYEALSADQKQQVAQMLQDHLLKGHRQGWQHGADRPAPPAQ